MDYYAIGQRIRMARKSRGLSQEALAELVGISVTHMSHIETGNTKLSLVVLVDLAEAMGVCVNSLLYDDVVVDHSTSIGTIVKILETCTPQQVQIIEDLVRVTKDSLEKHMC